MTSRYRHPRKFDQTRRKLEREIRERKRRAAASLFQVEALAVEKNEKVEAYTIDLRRMLHE